MPLSALKVWSKNNYVQKKTKQIKTGKLGHLITLQDLGWLMTTIVFLHWRK